MAREFISCPHLFTGENALSDAASTITSLGNKCFIVTDEMMIKLGNIKKLTDILEQNNKEYVIFSGISGEPTDLMINEGLNSYLENGCDYMVAMGGGSPIDSMKAIAMSAKLGKGVNLNTMMGKSFTDSVVPMVAIPTTAGTGSETTQFTIITDTVNSVKMLLKGPSLIPAIAIIDPSFTMTAPKSVTAATGVDALCHAVEAYTSRKAQTLSNTFALSAIEKIFKYLPVCYDEADNVEARTNMAIAAYEAGCAFNNSSVTIVHGMSRPIGANFHIAHGLSNAVLLEACINYCKDDIKADLAEIARKTGISSECCDVCATNQFLEKLHELLVHLNIPSMKEIIKDHDLYISLVEKMASDAIISGSPANTKKDLTNKDLESIYLSLIR